MARMPKTVRIAGHQYKIALQKPSDKGPLGYHDRRNLIIGVMKVAKSQMAASIIHEILHAAIAESGMRARLLDLSDGSIDLEEEIVSRIEGHVYSAIRDNPKLIKFIMEA